MFRLECNPPPGGEDGILEIIALHDPAGIDHTTHITAWFDSCEQAEACAAALPVVVQIGRQAEENWNQPWQARWQPQLIGRRWFLAPPWDASPAPAGRIRLDLHPGTAFGNGDHPATHLCLEAMEELVRPGGTFLDIGCGSGLLCLAAQALGASAAAGCDVDSAAVAQARRHGVSLTWAGSAAAGACPAFDLVVANLPAPVTLELLPEIRRVARPGAHLIASGLLEEQLPLLAERLSPAATRSAHQWRAVVALL
jgi:ribosomal protein L11 methyltransferase